MAIIVVGGHARNVGKTSVVAGIISAFPQYSWTAIKVSSHRHREFEDIDEIFKEKDSAGGSDTSRFLAAGATRSLWVRIGEDNAEPALKKLTPIIQAGSFVIIESNYILKFLHPDLYILVLRRDVEEFKNSAKETLSQADAAVLLNPDSASAPWRGIPDDALKNMPVFAATDPQNIPQRLIDFVQSRIGGA